LRLVRGSATVSAAGAGLVPMRVEAGTIN